jgi:hypothetical protein
MELTTDAGAEAPGTNDPHLPPPADPQAGQSPAMPDDPDEAELAEARREAAAAESPAELQSAAGQEPKPAHQNTEAPAKSAPGPIPYERFAEVAAELRKVRESEAYLQGQLDALRAAKPPTETPPVVENPSAAPANPADEIKALRAKVEEAAERFDNGEIGMREYEQVRAQAEDRIAELNLQRVAQPPSGGLADEALLASHAARLDAEHPYLPVLELSQLRELQAMAEAAALVRGQPYGQGPRELMRLRQDVARLSDIHGPEMVPNFKPPARSPSSTAPSNGTGRYPDLSPAAQARARKLEMAADMPPNVNEMGSAGGTDGFSDARINAMTDDEIAALPAAVRARILSR